MEIGYIPAEQLLQFRPLLLPRAAEALDRGEPLAVLGLAEEELAVGALAAYINASGELELVSLFVAPDYRRRGGGRLLLETLLTVAYEQRPACIVTADFTVTCPENETLAPFLKAMGFQEDADQGENIYYTTLHQAMESPFFAMKAEGEQKGILPFSKVKPAALLDAERAARKELVPLPETGLSGPDVEPELSCALVQDGIVTAFLVMDHSCDGRLTLATAWSGIAGPAATPALLHAMIHAAEAVLPPETPMAVQAVNQASARLIQTLLPEAKPISMSWYYFLSQMDQKGV